MHVILCILLKTVYKQIIKCVFLKTAYKQIIKHELPKSTAGQVNDSF